ncbi:hypothetical protein H7U34_06565 [Collinsella tanakaei]|nr:hypothetical protein [Collinsella tanakaei]
MDLAGLIGGFLGSALDYCAGLLWGLVSAVAPFAIVVVLVCTAVSALAGAKGKGGRADAAGGEMGADPSRGLDERYWRSVRSTFSQDEASRYDGMLASARELERESDRFVARRDEESARRVVLQARRLRGLVDAEQRRMRGHAEYRRYLALHYASFTAANGVHGAREQMKSLRDREIEVRRRLDEEITRLKKLQANGARNGGEIADACRAHKRACILIPIYSNSAKELYDIELAQNDQTAEVRDYIGSHFGELGRRWYRRLMSRKATART